MAVNYLEITFLSIVIFLLAPQSADSATCKTMYGYDGCACQMSDTNETLALRDLIVNKTKPRFVSHDNLHWYFAFQPCGTFNMFEKYSGISDKACVKTSSARFTNGSNHNCHGLGLDKDALFNVDDSYQYPILSNTTLKLRNIKESKGMTVSLICNRNISLEDSIFNYVNRTISGGITYYFSLESLCSCPGGCSTPTIIIPPSTTSTAPTTKPSTGKMLSPGLTQLMLIVVMFYVMASIAAE